MEIDKAMNSKESVNFSASAAHVQSVKPYNWMLDGESVLSEMPVKYAMYLVSTIMQNNTTDTPHTLKRKPRFKPKKTDIAKIIATDRRIAFINKNGELYEDKVWGSPITSHCPRQFFFYGKDAFDEYLGYVSDHNQKIISDFKRQEPKFEEYFNKKGMIGKYMKKLRKEGYITSVYFANELNLTTQKDYLSGNVNKGKVYKVLHTLSGDTVAPTWFLDSRKKGIQIKAKELNLFMTEESKAYADRGKNIRARLAGASINQLMPTDFFIRINKNQIDDMTKLVNSISGKITEMDEYTDKGAAKDAIYEKYLRKDEQSEA